MSFFTWAMNREWERQYAMALSSTAPRTAATLRAMQPLNRFPALAAWYDAGSITPDLIATELQWQWFSGTVASTWGAARIVPLFRTAGFLSDSLLLDLPTAPLTIYCGCVLDAPHGMSWTTDPIVAEYFATSQSLLTKLRGGGTQGVYQAEIDPAHVLAQFVNRNENEVVIDPAGLRNVCVVS